MTLHPEKTRLLAFGRSRSARRTGAEAGTFDFLGFTHVCARSRRGKFTIHVRTMRKRLRTEREGGGRSGASNIGTTRSREQAAALNAKLRGHYQYYGRPTNYRCLLAVLSARPQTLAQVAEPPHAREAADLGRIFQLLSSAIRCCRLGSVMPGPARGVLLEEPSAGICTLGSVRGGASRRCYGAPYTGTKPETADTAKEHLQPIGTPLLGEMGIFRQPHPNRWLR